MIFELVLFFFALAFFFFSFRRLHHSNWWLWELKLRRSIGRELVLSLHLFLEIIHIEHSFNLWRLRSSCLLFVQIFKTASTWECIRLHTLLRVSIMNWVSSFMLLLLIHLSWLRPMTIGLLGARAKAERSSFRSMLRCLILRNSLIVLVYLSHSSFNI